LRHALAARLSLFGVHPNLVAPFFALALPLAGALVVAPGRGRRGLGLAAFAAAGALLLLTRSRAAILAGGLGTAAFVTLRVGFRIWRARPRRSTVAGLLGLGLAAAAVLLAVGHERIEAKLADSSMRFRLYVWGVAAEAIAERPVRGHGLLSGEPLAVNATPSDLDGTSKNVHAHDVLLALALGAGWPAAALYLLLLTLLVARLVRALPRLDAGGRALAAGVVASSLALFGANLLDLGLSNHAPIAFHLGWLLGVAGLLVRVVRGADEHVPSPLATVAARGAGALLVLALAWNTVALAGEAGSAWTRRLLARGELAAADRWSAGLRRLNPHDLSIGMLRVRVLRRAARTAAERETLRDLAARHPTSPIPRESLSALELARGRLEPALEALTAARALDPTGPLAAEWSLRAAQIELRRGRRRAALAAFAEAFRYDTQAARRVDWRRDEDGRWVTGDDGAPLALDAVLERNRALLEDLVRDDPVRARRAAAALAFTYRHFGRDEEAIAVVDEYEALGGAPFVPLLVLRTEIREELDEAAANDRPEPASDRFHAPGDTAALRLAEGRMLAALGRPEEARAALREGLAATLDFASENENLGLLSEAIVRTHLAEGDVDAAAAALPLPLYANESPALRVARLLEVAGAAAESGREELAARVVDAAVRVVPHLAPGRDADALDALAALLGRLDRGATDRFLGRVATSGAGLSLAARVHASRGEEAARRSTLDRLREEFPAWAE
ncbi:MAG: O-antigen ligase family protein, partial [Planctomycetota bacterium JB042]